MFGLSTDAVEDRIPPEARPNARAVRVPISQVANGACELSAWGGIGDQLKILIGIAIP